VNGCDHLVHISESSREIIIFRVDDAGRKTLYTKVDLPNSSGWCGDFCDFSKRLGESILVDSPVARGLLKI